jgi:hypothetical protein
MHSEFKDWLIKGSDKWSSQEKQNFLQLAKSQPDKVVEIIAGSLMDWATAFAVQTGAAVSCYDIHEDSQQLFAALKEHFAAELAATA